MKTENLRVEKIGGTSMTRFSEVVDNIILGDPTDVYHRVYVVSAYGGVTNELLEHKKSGKPGVYRRFKDQSDYQSALKELGQKLCVMNQDFRDIGLDLEVANRFLSDRFDTAVRILDSMYSVLASGYLNRKEVLLAARELLASLGEIHSAFNSTNILTNRGYGATFVDLSGWEDGRELSIDERILDVFRTIDTSRSICFVTGYAKGTEGIMRQFDRGYSEVTFSKVAVLLEAKEAVIHKEFHLSSGDPNIVGIDHVRTVCNTNFDVADQLADIGMEAIHPKASKPLEVAGIPIRVKNAFDPRHPGTLITNDYICPETRTEIIAGSDRVTYIDVHDTRMVGEVGFDIKIMQILANHSVSYVAKATNANTIGITIYDKDCRAELISDLKQHFESVSSEQLAIVCAIGSNIAKPGVLAQAARALANAGINILAVSQTARQTNMQFLVSRDQFKNAQIALHRALCE
ncbi:MAG: aspartate kinase [Deltaproteobacteria bacterium]|nr:aspartate kinase [Deltaproteobacteria bacterium]